MKPSKLLAILVTDLSGFTAFTSSAHTEDLDELICQQKKIITPIVDGHHGTIIKWIGDSALVTFESATDAILAGRKIQNAFIGSGERGANSIEPLVKAVVHLGDVRLQEDGDIIGTPVNVVSRMEKAAEPDQVYFSEAVRTSIPKAEIPCDYVGEFEFKGIPEKVRLYKTAFSNTPIVRDRVALVNTNFVGLSALSEKYTWDVIQPMVDETVGIILSASRAFEGTKRDTNSGRCFLSFESVGNAISAISKWNKDINNIEDIGGQNVKIEIRSSIHWGTLHVMKNTIMGKDMHIAETLCALGFGNEVLLTQPVVDAAKAENISTNNIINISLSSLRQCSSHVKWMEKFRDLKIYKIDLDTLTDNKRD